MKKYKIGNVPKNEFIDPSEMATEDLEPKWDHEAILTNKLKVSKDSAIFTFKFKETFELDLKPGQHITFITDINGTQVMRPYTPIECRPSMSEFDTLIKIYPDGVMTQHLDKIPLGSSI